MPLPSDLDSIDLVILRAIANQPEISTRQIEVTVYLSRTHVLRRLRQLEHLGLIVFRNSIPGQAYYYTLAEDITPEEIEQYGKQRLETNRDPVAREALSLLLQGVQGFCDSVGAATNYLSEVVGRIESILK